MSKAENKLAEELARQIYQKYARLFDDWGASELSVMQELVPVLEPHLVGEWQPIADAPKDGRTLILGYWNPSGNWRTMRGQWFSNQAIADEFEEPDDFHEGWFETSAMADDPPNCWPVNPTHFQYLPAPPKGEQSQ